MSDTPASPPSSSRLALILAWLGVGLPMLWGVMMTVKKAALLFQ